MRSTTNVRYTLFLEVFNTNVIFAVSQLEGLTMYNVQFETNIHIINPEQLRQATLKHKDVEPGQTFCDDENNVDTTACLIMILDPGSLAGCKIHESSVDYHMDGSATFKMDLNIFDKQQLRQAALKHKDNVPPETFLDDGGDVDIEACLIMLLDTGSLAGCSIQNSSAEINLERPAFGMRL